MLTCAMCGKPMRECCDIYHVAKNKQGRECIICGDCAEELEAYAESQRKSAQEKRGMREVYAEAEPLKPCPFCGEAPAVEAKEDDCCGKIRCSNKDCLAHVYVEWDDFSSVVPNRGEAIAAWNRRAGE